MWLMCLTMRALVISDIHGNYEALKSVLRDAGPYDEVIVLGDLVDYGPDPDLVIDELRSIKPLIVRGNHDEAVLRGVDCRSGPQLHEASVYTRENITLRKLGGIDLECLKQATYRVVRDLGSIRVFAAHASVKDPLYKYLYPWLSEEVFTDYLGAEGINYVLIGHTHYQFLRPLRSGVRVINPGSVGQPRDGDWRAAYALISDSGEIAFRRVKYSVEITISRLKELIGETKHYVKLSSILRGGK